MTVPTGDWFTFAVTLAWTIGAMVGFGYDWRARAEARGDLAAALAEPRAPASDVLLARRHLGKRRRRLWWWLVPVALGGLSMLTPVRADAQAAVLVMDYLDLPARAMRDAVSVAIVAWELSLVYDQREDDRTRGLLDDAIAQEVERIHAAEATGGVVGGLRKTDPGRAPAAASTEDEVC